MSERVWSVGVVELGERIAGLTLAGAAELKTYLEKVHGVRTVQAPRVEPIPPLPPPPPVLPSELTVVLDGYDPSRKIQVVKAVRELLTLGLKEAKDLVDAAPRTLKEGLAAADAARVKDQLETAGARIVLK